MKRILSFVISTFICGIVTTAILPNNTYAVSATCDKTFLGLKPWYYGLTEKKQDSTKESKTCVIKQPSEGELPTFAWTIILNIVGDLALVVGYAAIIFVIYGGYKYIMSTGEPSKISAAKQIITNALIGLVIAILATVIVNTILVVIGGAAS